MGTEQRYRVAVVGRTGGGNYGHDLDWAFVGLSAAQVIAIADPDPTGREAAGRRTGARALYADYETMLDGERPDIVVVAPRWVDDHEAVVVAAAHYGAHVYCEKPLARTPAEADRMLAACAQAGVRLAVAHTSRVHPRTRLAQQLLAAGLIGRLRLMRGYGKGDRRAGGTDLMVLGTHAFDLMRFFAGSTSQGQAGDCQWVSARLVQDGRDVTVDDAREGEEGIGLVAGDGLLAHLAFQDGMTGFYESFQGHVGPEPRGGLDLCGTEGILSFRSGRGGYVIWHCPDPEPPPGIDSLWRPIAVPGWGSFADGTAWPAGEHVRVLQRLMARELLDALCDGREHVSSGADGRAALEMIMAVHLSHLVGQRVTLPLAERDNPYRALRMRTTPEGAP